ncbi:MAG TPA: hypothetical protein VNI01_12335 [Elusimicrobiota bacterium]|jgi:hypothetical protein|nr:hypothetical protein [Elusimicrobiota bacterium]
MSARPALGLARLRSPRGSILVYAVITILLLTFIFTWCLNLAIGDSMMTGRSLRSEQARRRALSVQAQAHACLDADAGALGSCSSTNVQDCINGVATATGATITLATSGTRCVLSVTVSP